VAAVHRQLLLDVASLVVVGGASRGLGQQEARAFWFPLAFSIVRGAL
jgi:hypothetical protein